MGVILFIYPFLFPAITQKSTFGQARLTEMPLLLTLLLALCLVVLLYEVQGQAVDTKLLALLGILVAINSALRFMEIAIPGPAGFSPIFFLIILTGYVFGGRFGFLLGVSRKYRITSGTLYILATRPNSNGSILYFAATVRS